MCLILSKEPAGVGQTMLCTREPMNTNGYHLPIFHSMVLSSGKLDRQAGSATCGTQDNNPAWFPASEMTVLGFGREGSFLLKQLAELLVRL